MTLTNHYCTLSELQSRLGRELDASDVKATQLEAAIEQASREIDDYTSSFFYEKTISTAEKVDSFAFSDNEFIVVGTRILLPAPITTLTSITVDGVLQVENTDFYVYDRFIENPSGWSSERKGISIITKLGYTSTPKHINKFCLDRAANISMLDTKLITDQDGNVVAETDGKKAKFSDLDGDKRVYV